MSALPLRVFQPEQPGQSANQLTVREIVRLYLAHLDLRVRCCTFSATNVSNIRRDLTRFAAAFDLAIEECRQSDLVQWLAANPQWKSGHTQKHSISSVLGCFNWAADDEGGDLIDRSPYRTPKILKSVECKSRRPASHAEYVSLMRHGTRALRRALFMMRRCGIRTCEIRALRRSEILLDGEWPHINLENHKTRTRTGKAKKIGLDCSTANFLRAVIRNSPRTPLTAIGKDDWYVFTNCDGGPWKKDTFGQHLRRCAERIGLDEGVEHKVTAYCLRHTYACDAVEAGVSIRQIADQLGHSTTAMIEKVYASHTRDREKHLSNVATDILRKRKRK